MEGRMRVLLVDDEEPARERLRRLLASREEIEIVGEAEDGEQALERIETLQPDALFLDIQMPGCNGLEVAASIQSPRPKIVFCTAYEEHAVDAFELHAVDYLLKPVNRARLEKTLERLSAVDDEAIDQAQRASDGYPTRFLGKRGSKYKVIPAEQVLYFLSEGGDTKLQTGEGHLWMQPTLGELEQRLDPSRFFRISRAALLNLDHVREVLPGVGGQGEVRMEDGVELTVSRRRYKPLLERLGH